jgi:hypothetical protein
MPKHWLTQLSFITGSRVKLGFALLTDRLSLGLLPFGEQRSTALEARRAVFRRGRYLAISQNAPKCILPLPYPRSGAAPPASDHHTIEDAVMASEIEQLLDLTGFLKVASQPQWRRVQLVAT